MYEWRLAAVVTVLNELLDAMQAISAIASISYNTEAANKKVLKWTTCVR